MWICTFLYTPYRAASTSHTLDENHLIWIQKCEWSSYFFRVNLQLMDCERQGTDVWMERRNVGLREEGTERERGEGYESMKGWTGVGHLKKSLPCSIRTISSIWQVTIEGLWAQRWKINKNLMYICVSIRLCAYIIHVYFYIYTHIYLEYVALSYWHILNAFDLKTSVIYVVYICSIYYIFIHL